MNLLDHRILIWDHEGYTQSRININQISEYFDFLCDSLKSNSVKISIDIKVFNEIFADQSIPLGEIHELHPELIDIRTLLLSQISNLSEHIEYTTHVAPNSLTITPNIFSNNYSHLVIEGMRQSFNYILCIDGVHIFLSMEGIADFDILEISNNGSSKNLLVFNNMHSISEILDALGRSFEMNVKHDPIRPHPHNKGDKVSILSADQNNAQALLIFAKGDSTGSNKPVSYTHLTLP